MNTKQQGFTLIELVMVIVVLGILAVVAIPQFVDLRTDARQGATDGVAGALGSASAINYAACQLDTATCVPVSDCTGVGGLLAGGAVPTDYTITAGAIAADATATCTVTHTDGETATFVGHGT